MIRLMGILSGSALAIALLILTIGLPQLTPADVRDAEAASALEPGTAILESAADAGVRAEVPATMEPPPTAAEPVPAQAVVEETSHEPTQPQDELPPVAPEPDIEWPLAVEKPETESPPAVRAPEPGWYAFWSPFRSQIAADGFVAELQRTTGLDYRVVKVEPGIYEVAFAYTDDSDIEDKLARISAATGMDMSGG